VRTSPPDAQELITGSRVGWGLRVESWQMGFGAQFPQPEILAESVPIVGGSVQWVNDDTVSGSLTFQVPAEDEWVPKLTTDPLAAYGQQLRVIAQLERPGHADVPCEIPLGWFRIESTTPDGDQLTVKARDPRVIIEHARFLAPWTTRAGETFTGVVRRMLDYMIPVWFAPALNDRACPVRQWDRERIDALQDMLNAWPAIARMDEAGVMVVTPPYQGIAIPQFAFRDGEVGTVVSAIPERDESSGFNAFVASGTGADGQPVWAAAFVDEPHPMFYGNAITGYGPYGRRPGFYTSDLLTTTQQCQDAARAQLDKALRRQAITWKVECAPDPRVEVNDPCTLIWDGGETVRQGWVNSVQLPATAGDGPMILQIGEA
jgi:hypothetical protein